MIEDIPPNAEIECFIGMLVEDAETALNEVGVDYRVWIKDVPSRGDCAIFPNRVNLRCEDAATVSKVWYG